MNRHLRYQVRGIHLAVGLVILVCMAAVAAGNGENPPEPPIRIEERVELALRVTAPEVHFGLPVQVNLIPMKPGIVLNEFLSDRRFLYIFNLDIYGGPPGKRIATVGDKFEGKIFDPDIKVFIMSSRLTKSQQIKDALFFLMPDGLTSMKELLKKTSREPEISDIIQDEESGYFYFEVYRWPKDDRIIIFGE